jgi:Zn-finger nucleic acid-binding protein
MNCPKDGTPMREVMADGVVLDLCSLCRGIWMDKGELGKVSKNRANEHELIFRGDSERMCPRCGKPMKKADLHSVIVEECECGIYFDEGEAERVMGRPLDLTLKGATHRVEVGAADLKRLLADGRLVVGDVEIRLRR